MDPTLDIVVPKEESGPGKTHFLPPRPHWRLFERGLGAKKSRFCGMMPEIGADRGYWNPLELELPLLETLSMKLVGVNVKALGDSLDPSPELWVFELRYGIERKGS